MGAWEGKAINFFTQMASANAAWELGSLKSTLQESKAKPRR